MPGAASEQNRQNVLPSWSLLFCTLSCSTLYLYLQGTSGFIAWNTVGAQKKAQENDD